MNHDYSLDSTELLLRPLTAKDIEPLRLLRNRPENRKWFFGSDEITQEAQKVWFERYLNKENDYMFAAFLPQTPERFVGAGAIYGYDLPTNSFELGRLLLDSANLPRRGLGVELVRCLCQITKAVFPGASLRAEVYSDNERSLRCFLKNGFVINGMTEEEGKQVILLSRPACK